MKEFAMKTQLVRTFSAPLLAASLALSTSAIAADGLYSVDDLMDAEVYDATGEEIGSVANILLGNDMSIHALTIKTGDVLGLGGREVVAERGTFTVRTEDRDDNFDDIDYQIHVEASQEALKGFPEYNEGWWSQTQESLSQAWNKTKRGSKSAWESTKEASASAWHKTKRGAERMGDRMDSATDGS
jgi:sporulation protein YlmC with PRC-barrel domain